MKLWQLHTVVGGDHELMAAIASTNAAWGNVVEWVADIDRIIEAKDQTRLNALLPHAYVVSVLARSGLTFYLSADGWLSSQRKRPGDRAMSGVLAFEKYGGNALAEARDFGTSRVR